MAVSACLLGYNCRYDGKNKKESSLDLSGFEVIPFCPENEVLGTPRETCDIVEGKMIGNESGHDYTELIEEEAIKLASEHPDIEEIYCKSKSPSCALKSAKVFNESKELLHKKGTGIFAKKLKELLPEAKFIEKEGK